MTTQSLQPSDDIPRKRGRPRKHASHADRQRAYLLRKGGRPDASLASLADVTKLSDFRLATTSRKSTKMGRPRKYKNHAAKCRAYRKDAKQAKRKDAVLAKIVEPLNGEYHVLVIDPPWPISFQERTDAPGQEKFEYTRMSLEKILALKDDGILPAMAEHCHVWLWTTQKFLPEAFRCFEAWGVRYVCTFVWDKRDGMKPMNLPRFTCEFAVYGRKGSPGFVDETAFDTCFHAPRGKPSEKPEAFYATVRRVTGGRRADIFSRRAIEGFDAWGAEAPTNGNVGPAEAVG